MEDNNLKKIANVAMPIALFDFIEVEKPGRMKNLFLKLFKACELRLSRMPQLKHHDHLKIRKKLFEFSALAGWEKEEKKIETYIAFCLCLLDKEDNRMSGIIEALNEICSFMENVGQSPNDLLESGAIACDRWEEVWRENKCF